MQTTNRVLMVRPCRFAFNDETAENNAFQQKSASLEAAQYVERKAVEEFDSYVALLRENGIMVDILQDTPDPFTPDSIFPNNCFSTHRDGTEDVGTPDATRTLVLYPMFAMNRRLERDKLLKSSALKGFSRIVDLTSWEAQGKFLEGTGSLVLDRDNRIAYACRSPRTCEEVVSEWARQMNFRYVLFDSTDEKGQPVYHTNVVMHVGTRLAIVCLDSVSDERQRLQLLESLEGSGKKVVAINFEQMHQFAGNMLELRNESGEKLIIMSRTARQALTQEQTTAIEEDTRIVSPDINAIETTGGGSARCMIAELF
ncbi:MAG: amidinotransferase [Prevotella sp.]|nr:amidinotransferase [Prevotella sp.]